MTTNSIPRAKLERRNQYSVVVAQVWLRFCGFHCFKCTNERISLLYIITLPFELYLHTSTMCSWHPPVQKAAEFSNAALEKRTDHPPWKMSRFVGHGFSRRRPNKPYLKFYMKKVGLFIYWMMPRKLNFGDEWPTLGPTGISCRSWLWVVIRDAYGKGIFQF
jgi:hypothetical protein